MPPGCSRRGRGQGGRATPAGPAQLPPGVLRSPGPPGPRGRVPPPALPPASDLFLRAVESFLDVLGENARLDVGHGGWSTEAARGGAGAGPAAARKSGRGRAGEEQRERSRGRGGAGAEVERERSGARGAAAGEEEQVRSSGRGGAAGEVARREPEVKMTR